MIKELMKMLNISYTENGAEGYKTTFKPLMDMNWKAASMRWMEDWELEELVAASYKADKLRTLKWLYYLRDVRAGLGERNSFRRIVKILGERNIFEIYNENFLKLVGEYGRWDDLVYLLTTGNKKLESIVLNIIDKQLTEDRENMLEGRSISLLAKWMPSINTHSDTTRKCARKIAGYLKMNYKEYRQLLAQLRRYLDVVEVKMSSNEWYAIDYEKVPSKANLLYAESFYRHDRERREEYILALKRGEVKINSSVLFPHDIVHKYWYCNEVDDVMEQLWKNLPDKVNGNDTTIVVADGSGSMTAPLDSKSDVTNLDVANALAIYFAERCHGEFKNRYITFSNKPQLVHLYGENLLENIKIALKHNEVANTNIEKVFDLILKTAIKNKMKQEEIPANILIISDMEFDAMVDGRHDTKLFEELKGRFAEGGYKLPKLIFWNLSSRTNTIPMLENEAGVVLVSGFSPNILDMVMTGETDPYQCLLSVLDSERYQAVEEVLTA